MLNFGIIGYGFMGKTHFANVQAHPDAQVTAVFTFPDLASELDGIALYTDDWRSLVDDPNVDAVVIATPTPTHVEMAQYAAAAKKHIFLEKPMARTVEQCQQIIDAATTHGVKLFIAHVVRYWPSYLAAYNALRSPESDIGDVKMIRALRYSAIPSWSKWFLDEKLSGGCILDLSIHDLDYAAWVMDKPIKSIYCEGRRLPEMDIDNWGVGMTTLTFENNEIAHCEATWAANYTFGFGTQCEIVGTKGIMKFDSVSPIPLKIYGEAALEPQDPYAEDGYYLEMAAFINCVLENTPSPITGEDGKKAVAIAIAAIKSATEKRPVTLEEVL